MQYLLLILRANYIELRRTMLSDGLFLFSQFFVINKCINNDNVSIYNFTFYIATRMHK